MYAKDGSKNVQAAPDRSLKSNPEESERGNGETKDGTVNRTIIKGPDHGSRGQALSWR